MAMKGIDRSTLLPALACNCHVGHGSIIVEFDSVRRAVRCVEFAIGGSDYNCFQPNLESSYGVSTGFSDFAGK